MFANSSTIGKFDFLLFVEILLDADASLALSTGISDVESSFKIKILSRKLILNNKYIFFKLPLF
jgi:hypothetical protein